MAEPPMDVNPLSLDPSPAQVRDGVAVVRYGRVAQVVLARPERHNALDLPMWRAVEAAFGELSAQADVRVIVVRGVNGVFSVGSDIAEFPSHRVGIVAADEYSAAIAGALEAVMAAPQPVLAMIDGLAVGGGCEIACACDLRLATAGSRFGMPIARLGVTIGATEARTLLRVLGPSRAKDLLFRPRLISAEEAARMGLLDYLYPAAGFAGAVWRMASEICAGAPLAAMANKLALDAVADGAEDRVAVRLRELTVAIYSGPDLVEGIAAFFAKRAPRFTGAGPTADEP